MELLFRAEAGRVRAYAVHRVGVNHADDIVAETFTVAWRRMDKVPADARPWLLAVARRVVANHLRGQQRRPQMVTGEVEVNQGDDARCLQEQAVERADLIRALRSLSSSDQELLLTVSWYDLTAAQAAQVLGCSQTALAVRLHRARKRLRNALEPHDAHPDQAAVMAASRTHELNWKATR